VVKLNDAIENTEQFFHSRRKKILQSVAEWWRLLCIASNIKPPGPKKIECAQGAPRPPCAPPRVVAGLDRISGYRTLALSACPARLARPIPRPVALVQLVRPRAYCSAPTGREGRGSRPRHRLVRFQRPSPQNLHMFL
jgi:hypothetical protein